MAEGPAAAPPSSEVERALANLSSQDQAVHEAAVAMLIQHGDASLLTRLEELRANADRSVRLAIKPVIDLLKNKAYLTNEDANTRRSAATDLGMLGKPVAIPWLEQAAVREPNRWVRYTMEEAAQLLKLASDDPATKIAAATRLGEFPDPAGSHQSLPRAELPDQLRGEQRVAPPEDEQLLSRAGIDRTAERLRDQGLVIGW